MGVLFGSFCLLTGGAISLVAAQALWVLVSFFALDLACRTSSPQPCPSPVPATFTSGQAVTLLGSPLSEARAANFRLSLSVGFCTAGVTCLEYRLSVLVEFGTCHYHLLFFSILRCDLGRGSLSGEGRLVLT